MKKFKLGTRVLVNGVETFIAELHADIKRGVYKVRTDNPTYEFTKNSKGEWWAYPCDGQEAILLEEAPKYSNYQDGDIVSDIYKATRKRGIVVEVAEETMKVDFNGSIQEYSFVSKFSKQPLPHCCCLKKLRVKLGGKK